MRNLIGLCMRCDRSFHGPDEGCPICDAGNPDVTSARNTFCTFDGNPLPPDEQIAVSVEISKAQKAK